MLTTLILAATVATANEQKVVTRYGLVESKRAVSMLTEVIRFPTYANNEQAHRDQKAWLMKTAAELGFISRDAGKVTEIELPATTIGAPPSAGGAPPVLGLVVHGDVQPVDAKAWSFPPFAGRADKDFVYGRGAADDKGPLVQALLAMHALKESKLPRTHTIRLLVGSEEESSAGEMAEYLKDHAAPDYSLVLDSEFPVVVGEKAWDALTVTTNMHERLAPLLPMDQTKTGVVPGPRYENRTDGLPAVRDYSVTSLTAGLAPSIVPDRAEINLRWLDGTPDWSRVKAAITAYPPPEGTRIEFAQEGRDMRVTALGRSAHAGVNPRGGRNALVALAHAMEGRLPQGGADDLLSFARQAGRDLYGSGLGITQNDPLWGRYVVNVATIVPDAADPAKLTLVINLRRTPPRTAAQAKAYLETVVADFNQRTGASLVAGGYFEDEPLVFNPEAPIVKRLLDTYERATGTRAKPAISGGGTYAKRLPNAIAFGMWFPDKPYPGHDVDEKAPIGDLHRGAKVLIHALVDIATRPKIQDAFK